MVKNIFLTGDLHVGKSTLLKQLVNSLPLSQVAGFRTSRYYQDKKLTGFYLEDICHPAEVREDRFIGRCLGDNSWVALPATFDTYGARILDECLREQPELVIMDELGFFENDAYRFQEKVWAVLDSPLPVLGVLKKKKTGFLDRIRARDDILLFEITRANREMMFGIIFNKLLAAITASSHYPSAESYDRTAREVFAPIYPVIAAQIKEKTKITSGICLDVGAGTGYLGIALAQITDLTVYLLDYSREMLAIAARNIVAAGLGGRVSTLWGNVCDLPFKDNSVDLVISRGSLYHWRNKKRAFQEIYRVLAPQGMTYIGGGFGSVELKQKIDAVMQARDSSWNKNLQHKIKSTASLDFAELLAGLEGLQTELINDPANMWLIMRKDLQHLPAASKDSFTAGMRQAD
ncbi:MAG: methyltransferase domain-containing protein [Firmicutes bacterium]|nr:methyltransferase domain-containing protein [Bacillota bacterium]